MLNKYLLVNATEWDPYKFPPDAAVILFGLLKYDETTCLPFKSEFITTAPA